MRLWQRIRSLPYTGLLLWPGDDGLRPYERRRMAREFERKYLAPLPKRIRAEGGAIPGGVRDGVPVRLTPGEVWVDPWDSCLDVDPFTGKPDHQHGDAQHEHGDGCIERECCE